MYLTANVRNVKKHENCTLITLNVLMLVSVTIGYYTLDRVGMMDQVNSLAIAACFVICRMYYELIRYHGARIRF